MYVEAICSKLTLNITIYQTCQNSLLANQRSQINIRAALQDLVTLKKVKIVWWMKDRKKTVKRKFEYDKLRTFIIIKPTRCTNFSNLFLEWKSTCLGQFLCPSSGVYHCTHSNGICHTLLLTACKQDQDGTSWSCLQGVYKPVWHLTLLCVQWKTPDDGQRNCPKHVKFHSKNKFEKLVHLVGFIIRNLSRCTVTWTSD
jgi:hypothetical protein